MVILCNNSEFEYLTSHSCVKTFKAPCDYNGRCKDMENCVRCFLDSGITFIIDKDLGDINEKE